MDIQIEKIRESLPGVPQRVLDQLAVSESIYSEKEFSYIYLILAIVLIFILAGIIFFRLKKNQKNVNLKFEESFNKASEYLNQKKFDLVNLEYNKMREIAQSSKNKVLSAKVLGFYNKYMQCFRRT